MDLYEVMRTTFAAREFTDEDVSDETLACLLENARFAPSGGNRQGWHVVVVKDQDLRKQLGSFISPVMRKYRAQVRAGENPFNTVIQSKVTQADIAREHLPPDFVERFMSAPVVLVILVDLSVVASMDSALERIGVISGASIYPFVWNLLLAARNEGLGGTLTTFLAASEPEVKEILKVPDNYAVCAMLPIGHPVKQLTRLSRKPVETFTSLNLFNGGNPFTT